jgi:hypothetical protein
MNAEYTDIAPDAVRASIAADAAERRGREQACALDFLVYADEDHERGPHRARCVHGMADPCSRDYDPLPYPEAEPVDFKLYAGTSIGALYGMGAEVTRTWKDDDGNPVEVTRSLLGDLAGWNLTPRSTH